MAIKIKKSVSNKPKLFTFALYLSLQKKYISVKLSMQLHNTPVKNMY